MRSMKRLNSLFILVSVMGYATNAGYGYFDLALGSL
jgi:hypothetical protein